MLRQFAFIAAVVVLLAGTTPSSAQKAGPNGGMVSGAAGHQLELVVSPTQLTVYLLEDGKPHDSTDTTMRAVIQQGGKKTTLTFTDQKGEKLVAKLQAPLEKGAIVVLTGKDHHGDQFNARYVLK